MCCYGFAKQLISSNMSNFFINLNRFHKSGIELIIKCPECGLEYSYGRNICHICGKLSIFFGAIFKGDRTEYAWNCVTSEKRFKTSTEKSIVQDTTIEICSEG